VSTATGAGVELVAAWRLLSLGFTAPDEETLAEIEALGEAILERAEGGDDPTAPALVELLAALGRGDSVEELAGAYQALFGGEVAVPPYEGSYEGDPFRHTRQMADVAGFYRAFGAEAHGPAAERVDHAGCELEFLAFLGAKRLALAAEGRDDEAQTCREIEGLFLRDHLGRWLPAFCRDIAARTSTPFYAALARAGEQVVAGELARRGIEPEPLGRRKRWTVEADCLECGLANAGSPATTPVRARHDAVPPSGG